MVKLNIEVRKENFRKKEIEIIIHLANGMNSRQIGQLMKLSFRTVDTYIRDMLNRHNLANRAHLVGKAYENRVILVPTSELDRKFSFSETRGRGLA